MAFVQNVWRAATISVSALVVGCGGGGDTTRASLAGVDPSDGFWAIRATCTGGAVDVEFRPGERLSVPGFGRATSDAIAVECGDPERVVVSDAELRRRSARPSAADLAEPTYEAVDLSCRAEGPLVVTAHPVFGEYVVGGGALRIERGDQTVVLGAILREDYGLRSEIKWWRRLCTARP